MKLFETLIKKLGKGRKSSASAGRTIKRCTKCGTKNDRNATTCKACGAKI